MLRERFTLWVTLTISLMAGMGYAFKYQAEAFSILLFIPAALHILYVLHVRREIARAHTRSAESISKATQHISGEGLKELLQQKEAMQRMLIAIDAIGNESQHDQAVYINGEAGEAIGQLKNKLNALRETERQRGWQAQGIAAINDIRKNNADLPGYAYLTIGQLVKYLNANQGSFFYLNEDDQLELLAAYAYGQQKHTGAKITIEKGSGLVGQCAVERQMIFMTNVPANYVKITSGLGEAAPRCIAIVPLLFRDEIFGVLEIAAFEKLEPHKLEFLTKACESIGLELYNIRTQERTRKMMEQSREEELRQNLEEMKATQREMLIKEEELSKQLITTQRAMAMAEAERKKNEAILEGCMDAVISFNQEGYVEYVNKAAEEVFGVRRQEVVGNHVQAILNIHVDTRENREIRILSDAGAEVSLRTEINATDRSGEEISLLLTATKVKIGDTYLFTLFAQKVSVELF